MSLLMPLPGMGQNFAQISILRLPPQNFARFFTTANQSRRISWAAIALHYLKVSSSHLFRRFDHLLN
jgi:hypothetical protein